MVKLEKKLQNPIHLRGASMKKKIVVRYGKEQLITPGGLATVGALLSQTNLYEQLDKVKTTRRETKIKNSDVVGAHIGLLCQGKNDYAAINELKEEFAYYTLILGTSGIASEETQRQRMDAIAPQITSILESANTQLLTNTSIKPTPCFRNYVPIDADVTPFDNSNSKKEGVSWTYKGFKGYAPILAYIGEEGYSLGGELRTGSQHSQCETPAFLEKIIKSAKKITPSPLLLRLDSGFDSTDNLNLCYEKSTRADFIIKRNLRSESPYDWLAEALEYATDITKPREGKTVYTGSTHRFVGNMEVRIVYEVAERTILPDGQILLEPQLDVATYWTSLPIDGEAAVTEGEVIQLYRDHATSEQFHSEIKTDMDLERFPSGVFKTNAAILLMGLIAYNILRIMGQESLTKDDAPRKRTVKRRRIKTVIQNLITIAVRVVHHARQVCLSLGRSNAWRFTFKRVHEALAG